MENIYFEEQKKKLEEFKDKLKILKENIDGIFNLYDNTIDVAKNKGLMQDYLDEFEKRKENLKTIVEDFKKKFEKISDDIDGYITHLVTNYINK